MSIKFTKYVIKTILCIYTMGLICATWFAVIGETLVAKNMVCSLGLTGELLIVVVALSFFRKSMSAIQKMLLVCDFCGIIAFVLFLSGACHDSWVFYGLLFVAMVTYTDLFSMNKIFDKKIAGLRD